MVRKAPRPSYSVLRSERRDAIELPEWRSSLRRYLGRSGARVVRLLVAGGAGFIGSTYVRRHLATYPDHEIVVLDKLTYAGRRENLEGADPERLRFVEADIADAAAVAEAIKGCDAVVNFAAESHVDRSITDPGAFIQTDVFGTYVLLRRPATRASATCRSRPTRSTARSTRAASPRARRSIPPRPIRPRRRAAT